jgi:RNA polymerase-binding transcription factor DksA
MDQAFLNAIQTKLLERQQKLEQELAELTGQSAPAQRGAYQLTPPDYGSDEDENSAEVATFTTDLSVKEVLESSLRDIRAALDRLAKGTYGTCKYCGKPIDERRLLARPASSSCVQCKEAMKSRT